MPYNPALPADHSPLVSAEMRGQLIGLNDRINAIPAGPQGPVGEVSAQQLADGLAATLSSATADSSANSNPVATLDTPFTNDPPTLADMEVLRAKLNELITAMRR